MKQQRVSEAIDAHLALLQSQGLAYATIKSHRQTLTHLLTEVGNIYLRSMTHVHVERFFTAHADWSPSTRNLHLANLRAFLGTCRTRGWMPKDYDPTAGWRNQKVTRTEKARIPVTRFSELLDAAQHPRDRALVAIGLFSFLRNSEARALRIRDVNLDDYELHVHRIKTHEEDVLPISRELADELVRWLRWYEQAHGPLEPDWYLLPAKGPNPTWRNPATGRIELTGELARLRVTTQIGHAYRVTQRILERLGIEADGEGGHTLRRSGARALFDALRDEGYDGALQRVRAMLGHKSATMTERYLGIDIERKQRNELIAGRTMFPSMHQAAGTVVPLRAAGGS